MHSLPLSSSGSTQLQKGVPLWKVLHCEQSISGTWQLCWIPFPIKTCSTPQETGHPKKLSNSEFRKGHLDSFFSAVGLGMNSLFPSRFGKSILEKCVCVCVSCFRIDVLTFSNYPSLVFEHHEDTGPAGKHMETLVSRLWIQGVPMYVYVGLYRNIVPGSGSC